jgi:beta-phosphoglucomutase family hydrolase
MIKAVIFDMDGTLVDTMEAHYHAWQKFLPTKGLNEFTKEIYLTFIGIQTKEIIQMLNKKYNLTMDPEKDRFVKEKLVDVNEISLYTGVKEMLQRLKKAGFKIGLGTSAIRKDMEDRLARYDLKQYFDAVVCCDDVALSKPHPDIFLLAAKKLKVHPKDCIVVEDALNGIIAAKKAGMDTIALTTTFKKEKIAEVKPDLILNNVSEITPAIIEQNFE